MDKNHSLLKSLSGLLLTGLLLTGCSTTSDENPPSQPIATQTHDPAYYLKKSLLASSPDKQAFQLQAVSSYLDQQQTTQALRLLKKIDLTASPDTLKEKKILLQARYEQIQGLPQQTLNRLNDSETTLWEESIQSDYHLLKAQAWFEEGDLLASIQERLIAATKPMSKEKTEQNIQSIWHLSQQLSDEQRDSIIRNNPYSVLSGWVELANMIELPSIKFNKALSIWQAQHPNHPGNSLLKHHSATGIKHNAIALILPLHGPLESAAKAIAKGFLAAFYQDPHHQQTHIVLLDSSSHSIADLYQHCQQLGVEFIVGPLKKENVHALQRLTPNTTILSLNRLNPNIKNKQIYEFSLSSLPGAKNIAEKTLQSGHKRFVVISPDNAWGKEIADTFLNTWQSHGGETVTSVTYKPRQDHTEAISQLLHISDSNARSKSLSKRLHAKIRSIPRRREDIDGVFLVAQNEEARRIRPLFSYFYAKDLPIYSIASFYQPSRKKNALQDLKGIIFQDMPWVLSSTLLPPRLRAIQIQLSGQHDFPTRSKLYALGTDAYRISKHINRLLQYPNLNVLGATGTISIYHHHVQRQLIWAKITETHARILP